MYPTAATPVVVELKNRFYIYDVIGWVPSESHPELFNPVVAFCGGASLVDMHGKDVPEFCLFGNRADAEEYRATRIARG